MKKKTLKENPLIKSDKKGKKVKINSLESASEDENVIRNFIFIIIFIVILAGIAYLTSEVFKKDEKDTVELVEGAINYDKVVVGTMLNRPYDEYYVLAYDSEEAEAVKYSAMITTYKGSDDEDKLKIYFLDLSNELNKKYYNVNDDNKSNKNAQKIEDLDFGDLTLLHIKKGKITEYLEDYKTIQEKLK